jgi:hypothetical protein
MYRQDDNKPFVVPRQLRNVRMALGLLLTVAALVVAPSLAAASAAQATSKKNDSDGPRTSVLDLAQRIHACARSRGEVEGQVLTVIDYSLPSTEPRLWVLDTETGQVLDHELVAHGSGSGELLASSFSNQHGTHATSLGLFRTGDVYHGRHGRSMRLHGLDPNINDQAADRAIVIHAADYVNEQFAAEHGRLGRSWGCPALDPAVSDRIIDEISGGTAVVAYYPDADWLASSPFVDCEASSADEVTASDNH